MRILIVKLSAIGDVLHTLPALNSLRQTLPHATLHWLVESAASELLENHPALDRLLVLPRAEWRQLASQGRHLQRLRSFLAFARTLRASSYDLAIDFQGLAKSGLCMLLARARQKAGFDRGMQRNEGAWLALNRKISPVSIETHALERGLLLLEALGFPRHPISYQLAIEPDHRQEASALLDRVGLDPLRPFAVINPITRWPTKDWEPSRFATTTLRLQQAGIPLVFTGAPSDRAAIDAIARHLPSPPPRLDGLTRLKVLAEICRLARVVLTTDTGPMHLAAAMGTPVIALFGPTAPWRTGPHGPHHEVLRVPLDCSPCFKRRCHTRTYEPHACMLRLDPDIVAAAVLRRFPNEASPLT